MALSAGTQDYVSACSYNLEYMENLNQHMLLSDWIIIIIVTLFIIRALRYREVCFCGKEESRQDLKPQQKYLWVRVYNHKPGTEDATEAFLAEETDEGVAANGIVWREVPLAGVEEESRVEDGKPEKEVGEAPEGEVPRIAGGSQVHEANAGHE